MIKLNLESVKLNGARVVVDNATAGVRMVSKEANQGPEAVNQNVALSQKRHLSSMPALSEADRGPRYDATPGGTAVPRAGRLAGIGGDLASRHPSMRRWFSPARQGSRRICSPRPTRLAPLAKQLPGGSRPTGRGVTTLRGR
jgi:hypothetical protein